jgi:hypothetical protein
METKCLVCFRKASATYCNYHEIAHKLVRSHYNTWVDAYGPMSWKEFLLRLQKLDQKGKWITNVIEDQLDNCDKT